MGDPKSPPKAPQPIKTAYRKPPKKQKRPTPKVVPQNPVPAKTATATPKPDPTTAAQSTPKAGKGKLTARIVGKRRGIKRVKFTAKTNCAATIRVHNTYPYHLTEDINVRANNETSREVWVYNEYWSELLSKAGDLLDGESVRRKTGLDKVE